MLGKGRGGGEGARPRVASASAFMLAPSRRERMQTPMAPTRICAAKACQDDVMAEVTTSHDAQNHRLGTACAVSVDRTGNGVVAQRASAAGDDLRLDAPRVLAARWTNCAGPWTALLCCVGNPRRMTLGRKRVPNPTQGKTQDSPVHFVSALWRPPVLPVTSARLWETQEKKKSLSSCSLSRWLHTAAAQPSLRVPPSCCHPSTEPWPATRNACPTRSLSIASSGSSSLAPRHTPAAMIACCLDLGTPRCSLPRAAGVAITCDNPKPSEPVAAPAPALLPRDP